MTSTSPVYSPQELRSAFGRYTTGVTIVTCRDVQGEPVGLTCNSFASLSLTPALVLWSLRQQSPSLAAFTGASHFAINVLAEDQVALSRHFSSPVADKFSQGRWHEGAGRAPVLEGSVAQFECRLHSTQLLGDHVLFVGEIVRLSEAALPPLVFQAGHYRLMGEVL
jgi:flavin reductase (DIM6/NTAB) family NADH-FMN oxidoreductase RutF